MKAQKLYAIVIVSLMTVGCAWNPLHKSTAEPMSENDIIPDSHADKVAMNLVFTVSQLKALHPLQTTIQMSEQNNNFGRMLKTRLKDAGYGLQTVTSDVGENYFRYKYEKSITEDGPINKFSISIGEVTAERVYREEGKAIVPDSPVMVIGSTETDVMTNDGIFGEFVKSKYYRDETLFEVSEMPEVIVMAAGYENKDIKDVSDGFAQSIRINMLENGQRSNFESVFNEYETIKNSVLIFDNDKMNLGSNNKK